MKKSLDIGYLIVGSYFVVIIILIMVCSPKLPQWGKSFDSAAAFFKLVQESEKVDNAVVNQREEMPPFRFSFVGENSVLAACSLSYHKITEAKRYDSKAGGRAIKSFLMAKFYPDTPDIYFSDTVDPETLASVNDYSQRYILLENLFR